MLIAKVSFTVSAAASGKARRAIETTEGAPSNLPHFFGLLF
jgi:hypothetical protein